MARQKEELSILVHRENTPTGEKEFRIKKGEVYQIVPKYDADAPDGFQEFRTTKIIDPEAGQQTINIATWDATRGVYDTALTMQSQILNQMFPDETVRQSVVNTLNELIVKPITALKGDVLDPRNNAFWDEETFTITLDEVFNTNDPYQLFLLYMITVGGLVAPIEFESSTRYNKTQYSVENKEGMVTLKQRKELEKNKAIGVFYSMLTTDKTKLLSILDWMKVGASLEDDEGLLNLVFTEWINEHPQNAQLFTDAIIQFNTPSGKKEIEMYSHVVTLLGKNRIKRSLNRIEFDGEFIGTSLKDATKKILQDKDLTNKVIEILQ